jgi:two-component sensor histidine kinase
MPAYGLAAKPATLATLDLVEEINHRVVNEFSEAIAMLSIAAMRTASLDARTLLRDTADRLRDHAETHRALMPPMVEGLVNLADHLGAICSSYTKATLADRGVCLRLITDDILLPAGRCWRVGLIVAELVRNAARHGLKGKGGRILVHVGARAGQVTCLVSDNGHAGRGAPGRGQQLIRSLVSDLGGEVEWAFTAQGAYAYLQVPIDDPDTLAGSEPTLCQGGAWDA